MSPPLLNTFPRSTRWLHALVAYLFIQQFVLMGMKKSPAFAASRDGLMHYHQSFGVLLLGVGGLFLLNRLSRQRVAAMPMPLMLAALARLTHLALWAVLLIMPLSGLLMSQWHGYAVPFFQWTVPALVTTQDTWGDWAHQTHSVVATLAFFLIGLHIIGALYHQVIMRDNTLKRMWRL